MKRILAFIISVSLLALTFGCTEYHAQGAGAGAVLGGVAGALLDNNNPWRGGVIGAAIGGAFGATITDISMRASKEAAAENRPVEYRTTDGVGVYRADPVSYNAQTKCHKVRERVWENDQLVKDQVKEICESDKTEPTY